MVSPDSGIQAKRKPRVRAYTTSSPRPARTTPAPTTTGKSRALGTPIGQMLAAAPTTTTARTKTTV